MQFYGARPTKPDGTASSEEALKLHKSAVSKQYRQMLFERRYFEATLGVDGLPGLLALQLPISWFRTKRDLFDIKHVRNALVRHQIQLPGLYTVLVKCIISTSTLEKAEKEGRLIRVTDTGPNGAKPYLSRMTAGATLFQVALFSSMYGSGEGSGLVEFRALCAAQENRQYATVLFYTESEGLELGRADDRIRWLAKRVVNNLFRSSLWEKVSEWDPSV